MHSLMGKRIGLWAREGVSKSVVYVFWFQHRVIVLLKVVVAKAKGRRPPGTQ